MNVKKVICAVLLGIGNILLFSILPFLMTGLVAYILNFLLEFIFGNIMSIFATIVFIPCVVLTSIIVYKLYDKLFKNTRMVESVFYTALISLSWVIAFVVIIRYFNPVYILWVFGFFVILAFLIDFVFILILNIIFILKSFKNDKRVFSLIIGILIQIFIPIIYILVLFGAFAKPYTDDELLKVFNKKINAETINIINVQNVSCEVDSNENSGTTISIDEYSLTSGKYVNVICDKGAKLYLIKANNRYYKVGTFIGTKDIIPTKQYEILDEYTIAQHELEQKENIIIKEIDKIAETYGYSKNGSLIDFEKRDIFITKVIMSLEEYEDVIMVNWLTYSNEIDIRFSNYKDKITINLNQYIEN